jgi:hypothetical protein
MQVTVEKNTENEGVERGGHAATLRGDLRHPAQSPARWPALALLLGGS